MGDAKPLILKTLFPALFLFTSLACAEAPLTTTSICVDPQSALHKELERLSPIVAALKSAKTLEAKAKVLGISEPTLEAIVKASLRLINQEEKSLNDLLAVEQFYSEMGGIVGYHSLMLDNLLSLDKKEESAGISYRLPPWTDITEETPEVRSLIVEGLRHLPEMAEIYPAGGAADRLRLQDEKTGEFLPGAQLMFKGKTLLASLIDDVSAREYLYYKLFGKQVTTPLALMTSLEKNNHSRLLGICEENGWFGRPRDSFRFFCQPMVPTMNAQGKWLSTGASQLFMKPGGHGVIWKLARDEKVFDWLYSLGRTKTLVRQINNPIAGVDYGLLAFSGAGWRSGKAFGFGCCPRLPNAAEGMDVIKKQGGKEVLTNIEYCHFQKVTVKDGEKFPANTNLLFADLKAVEEVVSNTPIPGVLINLKKTQIIDENNQAREEEVARLESTMQNLGDYIPADNSFVTLQKRHKTIAAIKRRYKPGASLLETPEGSFLDVLKNGRELLTERCHFEVPPLNETPSFIFLYHPSLGPLYSVISQKLRGGRLAEGAELQITLAELNAEELDVEGSLLIHAESPMGHTDPTGKVVYSKQTGKCTLKNVKVRNQGIDPSAPNLLWKNEIARKEACEIRIEGDGEFYAENLTLSGPVHVVVYAGSKVTAKEKEGRVEFITEPLHSPSWCWRYSLDAENRISLSLLHLKK